MEAYEFLRDHLDSFLSVYPEKTELAYVVRETKKQFQEHKTDFQKRLSAYKRKLLNNYLRQMRFGFRQATYYYFCLGFMNTVRYGKDISNYAMKDSWEYNEWHPGFTNTKKDKRELELSKKYFRYFKDSLRPLFCVVSSAQRLYMSIACYYYYMAGIEWTQALFAYAKIEPHPAPPEPYPTDTHA